MLCSRSTLEPRRFSASVGPWGQCLCPCFLVQGTRTTADPHSEHRFPAPSSRQCLECAADHVVGFACRSRIITCIGSQRFPPLLVGIWRMSGACRYDRRMMQLAPCVEADRSGVDDTGILLTQSPPPPPNPPPLIPTPQPPKSSQHDNQPPVCQ